MPAAAYWMLVPDTTVSASTRHRSTTTSIIINYVTMYMLVKFAVYLYHAGRESCH